jgi:1-phosphofructokinase
MPADEPRVITVTLNPTIDRILEIPGFRIGQHAKARLRNRQPSGKAFNVSRALAALGVPNTAAGFVGQDAADDFERAARGAGIAPSFVTLPGRTRENTTIIDPIDHTETHIREEGPTVSPGDVERLRDSLRGLVHSGATVVLTGSLAPGLSPEEFRGIVDDCIARGANVAVDTSGPALRAAASRLVWLLKPNREELAELVGSEAKSEPELLEHARRLRAHASTVLLSAGGDGAYLIASTGVWHACVQLPAGRLRSTVGCGDALLAGYLAAVLRSGSPDASALRQAVAVAAASAMNELPAAFSLDEVRELASHVQIRELGDAAC